MRLSSGRDDRALLDADLEPDVGSATTSGVSTHHLAVLRRPSEQRLGEPADPTLVVHASGEFMDRWAVGTATWDDGRTSGDMTAEGDGDWNTWLAGTGNPLTDEPIHA
jgi:hypothetical protein